MAKLRTYLDTQPELTRATVGYVVKDGTILLGLRKRVSFGLGESLIAGIGGKLEPDESDEAALKREFMEEISVAVTSCRLMGHAVYLFPHKPKWNQQVSIYLVDAWQGQPQETEDIRPLWAAQHALPKDRMWPDNLITIPAVLAGKRIEGIFLYEADGTIGEYELHEL